MASPEPPPLWMRLVFGRKPKVTLVRLVGLVVTAVLVFRFLLIPIRVSGMSMYPTYRDGKVNFVNHQAYRWKKPQRGDVVAFRLPEEGNVVLLKRIVGLPGERITVVDGKAHINDSPLAEPYAVIGKNPPSTRRPYKLKENEYFVMGDNRSISIIRSIPEDYILGKVIF